MDIDDLDSHICLQCQKHIIGLPNYVHHKKYDCPVKRHDSPATSDISVPQTRDFEEKLKLDSEEIRKSSLEFQHLEHEGDPVEKISGDRQQSDVCDKTDAAPLKRKVGRPPKHVKTETVQEETTTEGETSQIIQNTVDGKDTAESKTKENIRKQGCVVEEKEENIIKNKTTESVPRRRGRPRKHPLIQDEKQQKTDGHSGGEAGDFTIKRRVGRPRKIKHEGDINEKSDPAPSDATDEIKTNHTIATSTSPVTPGVKRNLSARGSQASPRKRHERYDGSDLYKPRLSLGGSRQRARQMEERISDSVSSPAGLCGLIQKEKHQSSFSKLEKSKHFGRKQKLLKSPNIALPGSERHWQYPQNTSSSSLDSLTDSKRYLQTYPPPEPEIISQLCQLRLHCHVETELHEPTESNNGKLEQVPAALRLVNMLNELNCDSDYEGLDHLPDIEHSDVDKHRKVTDTEGEETRDKSDAEKKKESSGSPIEKDTADVYKITASGYSFVLKLTCQNCNRYFINALAYHSHIKCSPRCSESKLTLHEKENTQELSNQSDRNSSQEPVGEADGLPSFSAETKQMTHIPGPEHNENLQDSNENSIALDNRENNKQPNENIFIETCPGCQVTFDNKYAYCKHLLHALGLQGTSDPQLQRLMIALKSYQCHLCTFYCSSLGDFLKHIGSMEHSEVVDQLLGDMVCIDCQYMTSSKKNIYFHFQSVHQQPDRPCLLKEVNQVQSCRFCGKTFQSSRAMRIHTAVEPGHRRASQHSTWCDICEKAFSTTTNLQQHIWRMHDHTKNFTCHVCNKNYSYKNNLDMHYKSQMHKANVHAKAGKTASSGSEDVSEPEASSGGTMVKNTPDVKVKQEPGIPDVMGQEDGGLGSCDMEKEITVSDASSVVKRGRGRPRKCSVVATEECKTYKCELCGYTLYSLRQLEKHQQSRYHIRTEEDAAKSTESFTCVVCQHKFYCKERFALHKLAHKDKSKHVGIGLRRMNRLRGIPERFHKLALSLPKKVKSEVQCPDCQGWFKANTIIPHIRCKHGEGNDLPYKCNFCPLTFASNSSLYRHHKRHVGLLSFRCKICNKGFRSKSDLESHELTFHKDELQIEPKLQCYLCGAGFMQQSKLNTHMKQKHEKVRKYWCSWPGCHRAFIHQQEYVIHMRGHTGEKPYLCDHCGFATKSKVQLARHERIHKNVANYKCKYCSYTSRMSAGLRRHMRLHTGAKPYRCPHCEHRCYSHTNLRLHINNSRLHPMLKLYNCRFCQFASNATTEFLSHMFEAHALRPEVIGNVAEYCGVYLPQEDVTEVKEGCEPLQLAKRKPRCKVSNTVKLQDTPASESEVMMEHAIVMKVEPDVSNMCIIESDETVADQAGMHREIQENEIVCYQQLSTEKAPNLTSKHSNQKYQVLSIRETPEGNIVFVDVHPPEEEQLNDGEHEAEHEQSMVAENHVMEAVYIPKVEKEEVIQSDIDQETSIIIRNDPSQDVTCAETSKPENIVYIQEQETPLAVVQQNTEQIGEDATVDGNLTLATQEVTEQVKQVYLTSEGIQLTELIQGLEDTGAIVELRMEDDCDVPEGKPGQVVQVIGDDDKPVHFYYV